MELLIGIAGTVIGSFVTYFVARYYFRRQVRKRLTPYLRYNQEVWYGAAEAVRDELKVEFRGRSVDGLRVIEVLVANDGDSAVQPINDLSLRLPNGVELVEARVVHQQPGDLDVTVVPGSEEEGAGQIVTFPFPLMNPS